jgi:flagellar protein FliL
MPTTTPTRRAEDNAEAVPAAKGGSRTRLLLIALPVVLLLAAAFFLLGPGSGGDAAADAEHAAPEPGEVLALDPITMNLADGRLLKVGLALQLPVAGGGHGGGEVNGSMALDEAISYLGTFGYDRLVVPAEREKIKAELSARVAERYHDEVMSVYFTQFVMQ